MPFQFTCPHCFKKSRIEDKYAGQKGPCAGCGKPVTIPIPKELKGAIESSSSVPSPTLPKSPAARAHRLVRTKLALALFSAVGLLLVGFAGWKLFQTVSLLPVFQSLQERNERTLCMNHLGRIARALNEYAATHGTYPPPTVYDADGKALYSWRVLILRELGEFDLHNQFRFDEPWDSEHNSSLLGTRCPRVFISPRRRDYKDSSESSYFLIVGEGTIFPNSKSSLASQDIVDGPQNTLLVVEAKNSIHEWTKPMNIDFSLWQGGGTSIGVGGTHSGGFTAAFADGTPAWIADETPPELIRSLITSDGGEPVDRQHFVK